MKLIILLLSLLIVGLLYQQKTKQVQTLDSPLACKDKGQDTHCASTNNPINAQMQLLCQQTGQIYDTTRNGCMPATKTSTTTPDIP